MSDTYKCPKCGANGSREDIMLLVMNPTLSGWHFIHFNNDEMRRPTIVCTKCFSGFDMAFLTSKIHKQAPADKVHKLMSMAFHLARRMNSTNDGLIAALAKYATTKGAN